MRRRHTFALLLLLIAVAIWPNLPAQAQPVGPLRVGLYFNSTTLPQVTVTSANGLRLGQLYPGGQWPSELLTVGGQASWLVRPEASGYYRVASNDLPDRITAEDLQNRLDQSLLAWSGSHWQVWVGTARDASEAQALASDLTNLYPSYSWTVVPPQAGRSELCTSSGQIVAILPEADIYLAASEGSLVGIAGKQQRGWLQLTLQNGRYRVINYVDVEDYLLGVVPREMSSSQPLEALKVQAVASRTFALTCTKHQSAGFDVCTTTCCQVLDHAREAPSSNQAVWETRGQVVTYNGQMVPVYYHADGGGHTENPLYVWGTAVPYLSGVPELYPTNSIYENWEERLSAEEIRQLLAQMGINVGNVQSVTALSYTPAGRVERLQIVGSAGSTLLEREQIRLNLRLRSRVYTITPASGAASGTSVLGADGQLTTLNLQGVQVVTATGQQTLETQAAYHLLGANQQQRQIGTQAADSFLFIGSGFGHGVGISQHGAYAMARQGHTFAEIIKYYLQGVEIVKLGD